MIIDLRILLLTITYTEDVVVEKEYTKPYFATMSPTLLRHHQHRFFFFSEEIFSTMKTTAALRSVRLAANVKPYEIPALLSVLFSELPNNGFGQNNYYVKKSKLNNWPVYLKKQNTKTTTEIKRIQGDVLAFKNDLLALNPQLKVSANQHAGYVNIKGDVVKKIISYFDQYM